MPGPPWLFDGVRLVFTNWRLTLVQALPAMWIFFAVGLALEAGATGAVKAVRMCAKLVSGCNPAGRRSATRFPKG
jgi:hypothetical protein